MTKKNDNTENNKAINYEPLLATVFVRFTYKDKLGVMGEDTVIIDKRDSELAIATFEKKHPEIVWREFSFV